MKLARQRCNHSLRCLYSTIFLLLSTQHQDQLFHSMAPPNVITTGHNNDGLSVFVPGPQSKAFAPGVGVLYTTSSTETVDLNKDMDITAFEALDSVGMKGRDLNIMFSVEWPPGGGSRDRIHRTHTVDRGVLVQGECECAPFARKFCGFGCCGYVLLADNRSTVEAHLDSGEKRILKQGDVLLQRGTMHYWHNPSKTETARMIIFTSPSKPIEGVKG